MRSFILSLFLLSGFAAFSAPALADPPSWAPAHGYRAKHRHRYVYYPSYPIYYAPERRLWFWLSSGNWLSGGILPWGLRHHLHDGVSMYYDSPYPYHYHHHTVRRYPRHHNGHGFNHRPFNYGDRWPGEWNYFDRRPNHGHDDRDRGRHHGRNDRDHDRGRHNGRHDGRGHGGDGGWHDGRDGDRRHDGRRDQDHGGRRHDDRRADRGPGREFDRGRRDDGNRGGKQDGRRERRS